MAFWKSQLSLFSFFFFTAFGGSCGRKLQVEEEEEEGGSIVWPLKGWGLRLYADVLLATDICSPPPHPPSWALSQQTRGNLKRGACPRRNSLLSVKCRRRPAPFKMFESYWNIWLSHAFCFKPEIRERVLTSPPKISVTVYLLFWDFPLVLTKPSLFASPHPSPHLPPSTLLGVELPLTSLWAACVQIWKPGLPRQMHHRQRQHCTWQRLSVPLIYHLGGQRRGNAKKTNQRC